MSKKLGDSNGDTYIRIRMQKSGNDWNFTYLSVDASRDGETWESLLSNFRLSTAQSGTVYSFSQVLQYNGAAN